MNKVHGASAETIELDDSDVSSETDTVALEAESELKKFGLDEKDSFPLFKNHSSEDYWIVNEVRKTENSK